MKVAVHCRSLRLPQSLRATGVWSGQLIQEDSLRFSHCSSAGKPWATHHFTPALHCLSQHTDTVPISWESLWHLHSDARTAAAVLPQRGEVGWSTGETGDGSLTDNVVSCIRTTWLSMLYGFRKQKTKTTTTKHSLLSCCVKFQHCSTVSLHFSPCRIFTFMSCPNSQWFCYSFFFSLFTCSFTHAQLAQYHTAPPSLKLFVHTLSNVCHHSSLFSCFILMSCWDKKWDFSKRQLFDVTLKSVGLAQLDMLKQGKTCEHASITCDHKVVGLNPCTPLYHKQGTVLLLLLVQWSRCRPQAVLLLLHTMWDCSPPSLTSLVKWEHSARWPTTLYTSAN